jgi:Ca-activated chloride channel family protein
VPLKAVEVHATLEGALATIDFHMTYTNPSENPIETTYEFPLEADTVLSRLTFKIGEKVVNTVVKEKEKAEEEYENIIVDGDLAVIASRQMEGQKSMSIKIGNLLPGEEITITAQLTKSLQIVNDAYSFILPVAFYPDYNKAGARGDKYPYHFTYSAVIKSTDGIEMISKPANSIVEYEQSGKYATIFCDKPDREI